ncbi:MAG: GNAT family N-acetyltransferase [Fibromonadales bacterium]|nr:GNAT family N-acetyltransferase [Fibromonadales bacterium]
MEIKLVTPSDELKAEALAYRQEHFDCGEMVINGSALFDKMNSYEEWLLHIEKISSKETCPSDWVVSSVFFCVRQSDNKIIGIIDLRNYLNDFLKTYGGHIGYAVRPSERRKGYATEMLSLALDFYKNLGLNKVMIACYKDNLASIKTIEKNGGSLEKEYLYLDGKPILIYWVGIEEKILKLL